MMWAAGILAALGSITYPAISAFVSIHSHPDRQGEFLINFYAFYWKIAIACDPKKFGTWVLSLQSLVG